MKRYISLIVIVFSLLFVAQSLWSQEVATDINSDDTELTAELTKVVDEALDAVSIKNILWRNVIVSALVLIIVFVLNFVILKYSYRFELALHSTLEQLQSKPHRKTFSMSLYLSGFLFFYDGLKWIIITAINIWCVSFLLGFAHLQDYWNYRPIFQAIWEAIALTIIFFYIYRLVRLSIFKIYYKFSDYKPKIMENLQSRKVSLLTEDKLIDMVKHFIKLCYFVILLMLLYFYITLLFSFFAFTSSWAETLFGYILTPLERCVIAFVHYLPDLFALVVIFFILKYLLQIIKFIFVAIEKQSIVIKGFYRDWALPTYQIVRFGVIVFGLVVMFPYLPGSSSPFFRGVSVFIGVLFSLGSTSAVGNIVSGIVLTYMRPFRIGDRVKIAETMGDVIEKTLLVTRIRTIKNVDITIPNAMVLGSHIINFSSSSADTGLIVHTSVTIGYDAPWQEVHKLLLRAADKVDLLLKDPPPFILQTALNDFAVSYELNAYTHSPHKMSLIQSQMHQYIQDVFNEAGVEIMSPNYTAVRDGNQTTIPENYLPPDYQKPSFNISNLIKP